MKRNIVLIYSILLVSTILISMSSSYIQEDPWPVPTKYKKMVNPDVKDQDTEQIGKKLYTMQCKSCHGIKGLGDGKKAQMLETSVGDFTSDEFKAQTDGELYYKTYIGRDEMPGFKNKISDEDKWLLINYIRSL